MSLRRRERERERVHQEQHSISMRVTSICVDGYDTHTHTHTNTRTHEHTHTHTWQGCSLAQRGCAKLHRARRRAREYAASESPSRPFLSLSLSRARSLSKLCLAPSGTVQLSASTSPHCRRKNPESAERRFNPESRTRGLGTHGA